LAVKVSISTFLIPAATLILPGGGQLLQGRFNVGLRHAATAVLLPYLAFFLAHPWGGILASILWLALGVWSAYDAWRWEHDKEPTQPPVQSSAQTPVPAPPWYRRYLPVVVLGVLQAVAAGEIVLFSIMAALGVMVFDAPGSEERIENWAFFIGVSLLPVVATVLCFVAWGLYRRDRPWWAVATLAGVVVAGLGVLGSVLGPGSLW